MCLLPLQPQLVQQHVAPGRQTPARCLSRPGCPQSKFDLTAASQLPSIYPQWGLWEKTHGHKPGVRLGQRFKGRGWLQALGLHTNYYAGIMFE